MRRIAAAVMVGALLTGCASRPAEVITATTAEGHVVVVDSLTEDYTVAGVRVIQRRTYANDVIAVDLYLLGGVQQLTPATAGIEALTLRAAEYGTAAYPGPRSRGAMARTGSVIALEPVSDWTLVGFRGVADQFDSSWAVFADRVVHPTLDSSAVAVARQRMVLAVRARSASPDGAVWTVADSVAFAGHPYSLDPAGSEMSLAALTPDAVRRYAHDQFVTSRMLLVVVGNVPRAALERAVTATLGTLPRGSYVWAPPPPAPRRPASLTIVQRPAATNYLLGFFPGGPVVTSPDYPAFELATELLGSRLHQVIRGDRSLSYAVGAPFMKRAVGTGGVYVSTSLPARVVPLVKESLDSLRAAWFTVSMLDRYTEYSITDYLSHNASADAQADALARAQIYQGDYHKASAELARLRHVSPGDVHRVVQTYMRDMQLVFLGDSVRIRGVRVTGL